MHRMITISLLAAITVLAASAGAQDIAQGKRAFEACAACHTGDPDGTGPDLTGVVGRRAGSLPGFRYSPAMKASGITWTQGTLRAFLEHPQATVRGNRMPYTGAANPAQAEAIAAYLASLK